jgi:hypothetical protein
MSMTNARNSLRVMKTAQNCTNSKVKEKSVQHKSLLTDTLPCSNCTRCYIPLCESPERRCLSANSLAPHDRCTSRQCPTFLEDKHRRVKSDSCDGRRRKCYLPGHDVEVVRGAGMLIVVDDGGKQCSKYFQIAQPVLRLEQKRKKEKKKKG